jgi:hypothetical protein
VKGPSKAREPEEKPALLVPVNLSKKKGNPRLPGKSILACDKSLKARGC